MQKSIMFFIRMLPVFFARVKPASHKANPACMKYTRNAPTSVQQVLTELNILSYLLRSFFARGALYSLRAAVSPKTQKALAELLPSAPLLSMARV